MRDDFNGVPLPLLIGLIVVLLLQGSWLFVDARKREANAWFWGLWGFIQTPMPILFYWLFVIKKIHKRREQR